jgi:hypothetical protein
MNSKLNEGDRVKLGATKRQWTVRGVTAGGRFAILTQPFNPKRTVLYTVIDFKRGVRGKDDHYGLGYETDELVAEALAMFQVTEDREADKEGRWQTASGADVSYRAANYIDLDMQAINDEPVTRDGTRIANGDDEPPALEAS